MIGKRLSFLFLLAMFTMKGQEPFDMASDTLIDLEYDVLFDGIKSAAKGSRKQGGYLHAYLAKAKVEDNLGELVQGYKNYLHRSVGRTKLAYADSMVLTSKKAGKPDLIGAAYLTKGIVFYNSKTYKEALENYLLADQYLAGTTNAYLQHKLKYNIALVKYYTEHYDEALDLLRSCRSYFQENSVPGYLNTLLLQGRCHQQMKNYGLSRSVNRLGLMEGERLGYPDLTFYFLQSEGINHTMEGNYLLALAHLDSSLHLIRARGNDFANEVLSEFYLGKSYWELGHREKAVAYFKKVDASFTNRGYMKAELLSAYPYLTEHYSSSKNQELRLQYLKKHIEAINFMRSQSQYLDDKIKDGYDLKGIQREKQYMERILWIKERREHIGIAIGLFLILLFIMQAYRYQRARKIYRKRFEAIINGQNPQPKKPKVKNNFPSQKLEISKEKIDMVLANLEDFEKKRKFLDKKMSARKLAVILEVNNKYLSLIITHYKGKHVMEYINDLRIDHIIAQMKQDRKLAHYSNRSLTEEAGFNSERTFTKAFKSRVGFTPIFFMERLEAEQNVG